MARSKKRKKGRKVPKIDWQVPTRQYTRDLNELVDIIVRTVEERIFPQLAALNEQHRALLAVDSPLDEIELAFESIRIEYERQVTDAEKAAIAQKNGQDGQRLNKNQVERQMRAIGLDVFRDSPGLGETMSGFNRTNTRLIKSLSTVAYERMEAVIERGFQEGKSTATIQGELQREFRITRNRAKLIARDQMGKLNGQLTRQRHLANGIRKSVWIDSGDERVRAQHEERDGREFDNTKGIQGEFPGGPVNCRCWASPLPPGT